MTTAWSDNGGEALNRAGWSEKNLNLSYWAHCDLCTLPGYGSGTFRPRSIKNLFNHYLDIHTFNHLPLHGITLLKPKRAIWDWKMHDTIPSRTEQIFFYVWNWGFCSSPIFSMCGCRHYCKRMYWFQLDLTERKMILNQITTGYRKSCHLIAVENCDFRTC